MGYDAPLSRVRVLDLTDGPMARVGRLLADLGADIVAVDLGGVTGGATEGPVVDGIPLATAINRQGIPTVSVAPGSAQWHELIAGAGIVIENTPPGSAAEAALDAPGLRRAHPRLVVLSISDFGRGNPFSEWKGTSPVFHSLTSELSRTGQPGQPPFVPAGELPYDVAATQAVVMTLSVYLDALRTGVGDHIDFSVLEGAMQALDPAYGMAGSAAMGQSMSSLPRGRVDLSHQYPIFPCKDGYIRYCVLSIRQWQGMFEWMGRPEEFADPRYNNIHVRFETPALTAAYAAFSLDKTRAELEAGGIEHGVPTAAVLALDEALETPQMIARGYLREVEVAPGLTMPVPAGILEVDGERATALDLAADRPDVPRPTRAPGLIAPRTEAQRPLEGLKVVDFGIIIVGGDTGRILADLGADVLKVENSGNLDGARQSLETYMAPGFASGHRNKRGVGINLSDPDGYVFARKLIAAADIVFTNWKPGVADKLGITYDKLKDVNPGVVVVDSSAFGPTGPWARRLGFGPLVRAATGFTLEWAEPKEPGNGLQFNDAVTVYPDHVSSRVGAYAALAVLIRRERTGRGGAVSISQAEVMMSHMAPSTAAKVLAKRGGHAVGGPEHDAPWGLFPARGDDEWVTVTVRDDAEWAALTKAIGRYDLADDPALGTASGRDANRARIDAAVREFTLAHEPLTVMTMLQEAGVPAGQMLRGIELPEWEFYRLRNDFRVEQHPWDIRPYTLENVQYHSERTVEPPLGPAPLLGQHTLEVASEWLGATEDEVQALIETGALEAPPLPDPSTVRSSEKALAH